MHDTVLCNTHHYDIIISGDHMEAQFKKGIIELCILTLIAHQDMYGYQIIKSFENVIDVNDNTVYPILRRLTLEHYFDTYLIPSNEGAPRKMYQITHQGLEYLIELRQTWDQFIGGVYHILNLKELDYENILKRIKK
jgi:PadR family transcriptional regulator PadR